MSEGRYGRYDDDRSRRGASAGSRQGSYSGTRSRSAGYSTRGSQGYSSRGSYSANNDRGYSARSPQGYSSRGSQGYSSRGSQGYSSRGSQGYSSRGSQGYSSRGSQGYPPRGSRGGSGRGKSGIDLSALRARVSSRKRKPLLAFLYRGKTATQAAIIRTIVGGVIAFIICLILFAARHQITLMRANMLRGSDPVTAEQLVDSLEGTVSQASLDNARCGIAKAYIAKDDYTNAYQTLSEVSDTAKAAELKQSGQYKEAGSLFDARDFEGAASLYYELGDYKDSAELYRVSQCAQAVRSYIDGNSDAARQTLMGVTGAVDVIGRAIEAAADSPEQAAQLSADSFFSADQLNALEAQMTQLTGARSDLVTGRIAVGTAHSCAISGGTVRCTGDNQFGQCDTSSWTGIVQVAAGAYHTVGLRSDGTVVACGNDTEGQCDVQGWTDITAIAAGSFSTLGLKSDGTVVACGMNIDDVSSWHDVTAVIAGGYSAACIYGQGLMQCTHAEARLSGVSALYGLTVCGQSSVGVLYDGSTVISDEALPTWSNMVSVRLCQTAVYGIDANGTARKYDLLTKQETQLELSEPAVEIECSSGHCLVLLQSGAVQAFGDNESGQCNVDGWTVS